RAEEANRRLDPLVGIPWLGAAIRPANIQEIADQPRDLLSRLDRDSNRLDEVGIHSVRPEVPLYRPEPIDDGVRRIANLVCETGGERAQDGQLFGVDPALRRDLQLRGT